ETQLTVESNRVPRDHGQAVALGDHGAYVLKRAALHHRQRRRNSRAIEHLLDPSPYERLCLWQYPGKPGKAGGVHLPSSRERMFLPRNHRKAIVEQRLVAVPALTEVALNDADDEVELAPLQALDQVRVVVLDDS